MLKKVIAIDQGTTSSRAVLFDSGNNLLDFEQMEIEQHFPHDGWVEHDPEEIWKSVVTVTDKLIKKHSLKSTDIASIGITNQRETTVLWDKTNGKPVYNAIVWQDRRTENFCKKLKEKNIGILITDHNVRETLEIVDRVYIVNEGAIYFEGTPNDAINNEKIKKFYLGTRFTL